VLVGRLTHTSQLRGARNERGGTVVMKASRRWTGKPIDGVSVDNNGLDGLWEERPMPGVCRKDGSDHAAVFLPDATYWVSVCLPAVPELHDHLP
jgi:hypothetical protein